RSPGSGRAPGAAGGAGWAPAGEVAGGEVEPVGGVGQETFVERGGGGADYRIGVAAPLADPRQHLPLPGRRRGEPASAPAVALLPFRRRRSERQGLLAVSPAGPAE